MPGPRPRLAFVTAVIAFAFALSAPARAGGPGGVDFGRDVRPILAKNCVRCHGPKKRQGGLALDARGPALAGGDGGPVIVPGKSAESRLFRYAAGLDEEFVMPPEGSGEPLTPAQVETLRAWIDTGADWPEAAAGASPSSPAGGDHWAFRKPVRPAPPAVKGAAWPRNPIDAFVLARLERAGMAPSAEADRATLIRRLSLDLTGLPPTPEEVDAFEADRGPGAYERVVDRLLASPAYGERWGRFWLDRARYADTNGYEKDRERSAWPYRDWVLAALNADMPFDRFTVEQIAGDMLPGATPAQRVATGFHRNTMTNEEGGIDVEEFRFASVVDRVATTGTVWLGLTVQCAQCHTHKYDPVTQREYYRLFAFLDNADEPEMEIPAPGVERRRAEVDAEIRALEAGRADAFPGGRPALDAAQGVWEGRQRPARWEVVRPTKARSRKRATLTTQPDGSVLATGDTPNNDVYEVELSTPLSGLRALRLEVLPDPSLPDGGPGRAPLLSVGDFLLTELTVGAGPSGSADPKALRRVKLVDASEDYSEPGHPAALAVDGVTDTGWSVKGGVGRAHAAVFPFREAAGGPGGTRLVVTMHQEYIHQMTIGRFRLSVTADPGPLKASGLPAGVEEDLRVAPKDRTPAQAARVRDHFLSVAPELAGVNGRIAGLRAGRPKAPTALVFRERAPEHARVTKVHKRGEFLKETDPVEPGVPAVLHPLPPGAPLNRLTLARWLVDGDNPLVGRVVMNQVWQAFFGRGVVSTPDDFGTRGARPTHPELLDWLAVEFPARGWGLKAMHRLIVTSATYRQTARATPEGLARDPKNEMLARGPRFRVDAEVVRDLALAASGLLSRKVGGPSVFPPQPEGVTATAYGQAAWTPSAGADRYRRGLYTYMKRTAPYAAFQVMDAPTSDTACVRRERSNTPLQALTLLNDAVFLDAARALARRALAQGPASAEARATAIFRLCLSRPPHPDELRRLTAFYDRQRARFRSGDLDPAKVSGFDPKADAPADPADLAAWTAVARAVLNLDEAVTKE